MSPPCIAAPPSWAEPRIRQFYPKDGNPHSIDIGIPSEPTRDGVFGYNSCHAVNMGTPQPASDSGGTAAAQTTVPIWFDIDPHGRVAPQTDEARRALADRAGRFAMLPSIGDLLVAVRTPPAGGTAPRSRCLLAGDLAGFPISDLVALIHQSRVSGTLAVSSGDVSRFVTFKEGEVRSASSEAPGERIGEVAVRLGFLTRAQLDEALAAPPPIGRALVERGFLNANDLWKCFHEQVTTVFHSILMSPEGVFWLTDAPEGDRQGTPLSVNTQSLLMDGIRRIDEMGMFRSKIPGPRTYLRRREPKRPVTLEPAEQQLLDLVNGLRRVAEIAREARLSEFDATKILYHLAEAGYVEAAAQAAAEARQGDERLRAIAGGMNTVLRDIALALASHRSLEPFLAEVRRFLADPTSRFAQVWNMVLPGLDGALDEGVLLGNLVPLKGAALRKVEPSGDTGRFLFDAMREIMFFYLAVAVDRLPRDDDDALSARVKQKLETLEPLR